MSDENLEALENECASLKRKIKKLEIELQELKAQYTIVDSKVTDLRQRRSEQANRKKISTVNSNMQRDWIDRDFEWSEQLHKLLKGKFGYDSFRPKQLAAINATISKNDVILVMPTGGGKSLVYQLPALVDSGFTIVVSPLISLIYDQLHALSKFKIQAATINSNTDKDETNKIYAEMKDRNSKLKLIYVTPEWVAKSKRFMATVKKCYENNRIARVAIDEVHCCSTWGHDFRPDYEYLGLLRSSLPQVPFLGLTATATMKVLTDIQSMLGIETCMIITAPFNRPNLFYKVVAKPPTKVEVYDYLENFIKQYKRESGIIYTHTVNESINLATELRGRGISAAPYHAQLESKTRQTVHRKWIDKSYQVVVATIAFGMGIDKPDVRFVIHHTIPKSMESLYQESGRAGRDGKRADCIVLYSLSDYFKVLGMASSVNDEKKALAALEYCLDQINCRRSLLATHFEEVWDKKDCDKMCDHCLLADSVAININDIKSACLDIHAVIEHASRIDEKLTIVKLLEGWLQTGQKKFRVPHLKAPNYDRTYAELIISYLLLKEYLKIDKGYNNYSVLCYLVNGKTPKDKIEFSFSRNLLNGFLRKHSESGSSGEPSAKKKKM